MAVIVHKKAKKKIKAYAQQILNGEIGGLLLGKIDEGDVIIRDAILLKQVQSGSTFELSDESLFEFTKNAKPKVLKSVMGWWHSHNLFNTFWSGPDDSCFERMCNLSGFCIGVVVAFNDKQRTDMKTLWRMDVTNRKGVIVSADNISPQEIGNNIMIPLSYVRKDVKKNVYEDTRYRNFCKSCMGTGYEKGKTGSELVNDAVSVGYDYYNDF